VKKRQRQREAERGGMTNLFNGAEPFTCARIPPTSVQCDDHGCLPPLDGGTTSGERMQVTWGGGGSVESGQVEGEIWNGSDSGAQIAGD
jgi:hypothetical protein